MDAPRMQALTRLLEFLDRHADFTREVARLADRPDWPETWLAAGQVAAELDRRQFWVGLRARTPTHLRAAVVALFLYRQTNRGRRTDGPGWCCVDGQYRRRPGLAPVEPAAPATAPRNDERRFGRIRCELLTCQFGEVVNISPGGVEVHARRKPALEERQAVDLALQGPEQQLTLAARLVWQRPEGKLHALGLEFITPGPEVLAKLNDLIRAVAKLV